MTFRDANGAVVFVDDNATTYGIRPGTTSALGGTDIFSSAPVEAASMQVEVLDASWTPTSLMSPGTLVSGPAAVRPDPSSSPSSPAVLIDCAVRSTYPSKTASIFLMIVYRDPTGKIIGGMTSNSDAESDTLDAFGNTVTRVGLKALFTPPSGVPAAECYPSWSNGG